MSANICANRVFIYELLPPQPLPRKLSSILEQLKWNLKLSIELFSYYYHFFSLLICSSLPHAPSGFIATSFLIWFRHCFIWIWPFFFRRWVSMWCLFRSSFQCPSVSFFFDLLLLHSLHFYNSKKEKHKHTHKKKTFSIQSSIFLNGLLFKFDPWPLTLSANNSMTVSIAFLVTFYHFFC